MQLPDSINLENACIALESLARQQALQSPELGAIELAAHALIFLTAPRSPDGTNQIPSPDDLPRAIKEWSSQGDLFEAYIASWKEAIVRDGTSDQRAFITYIEQPETPDFATNGDDGDLETRPFADVLPTPQKAIRVLEELAQRHSADSLDRVRVEFAIYVLRYAVEHQQVAALGAYLDEAQKRHDPYDHD